MLLLDADAVLRRYRAIEALQTPVDDLVRTLVVNAIVVRYREDMQIAVGNMTEYIADSTRPFLLQSGIQALDKLGGFWRRQKLTMFLFMIGAFSISGFPFFNGFISKSAIIASAFEQHINWAGLLLLLASVGTFLHTGLKIPYFVWFGKDRGINPDPAPRNMHWAMAMGAFLCTLLGVYPDLLYRFLPTTLSRQLVAVLNPGDRSRPRRADIFVLRARAPRRAEDEAPD